MRNIPTARLKISKEGFIESYPCYKKRKSNLADAPPYIYETGGVKNLPLLKFF